MKFLDLEITYKPRLLVARDADDAIAWIETYPTVANALIVYITAEGDGLPSFEELAGVQAAHVTAAARESHPDAVEHTLALVRKAKAANGGRPIEPQIDA